MKHKIGSIVSARGRSWIVQPGSDDELLRVTPITGSAEETTGILLSVEGGQVREDKFPLPDTTWIGDHHGATLMRLASKIANRNTTSPFPSLGRINVEPRPYQLVPLLLALRRETIRILIADDVGIGKTVESLLIARELLDRGEIQRFCILCPPHLAPQWQKELREKFNIEAELLLAATAGRLERGLPANKSVFDVYPFLVVSLDYIKQERRRAEFLRHAPELVIVDEAHTCASANKAGQLRYQVVKQLSAEPITRAGLQTLRHMVLVTATPHSGKEESFRRLIGILDPELEKLPDDLAGEHNERQREKLANFLVQRRRRDIERYVDNVTTPFPQRDDAEASYALGPDAEELLVTIANYAGGMGKQAAGAKARRIAYWSLLSLLRSFASSPRAVAATLRSRLGLVDAATVEEVDQAGREQVADWADEDEETALDAPAGSAIDDETAKRFHEWAAKAQALEGKADEKAKKLVSILKGLVKEKRNVIIFCHYIPTAEYLYEQLNGKFSGYGVDWVTGLLPPGEREERIRALSEGSENRILIATDCLSEGVNLQERFDSVIHYDLAWSPTRHEQREGRVDRFNQPKPIVKCVTYYGTNTIIDELILDVLLRKQRKIRKSTGVIVPAPRNWVDFQEKLLEKALERKEWRQKDLSHFGAEIGEAHQAELDAFELEWQKAGERESKVRTLFAQGKIKAEEVEAELTRIQRATATAAEVRNFVKLAIQAHGGAASDHDEDLDVDLTNLDEDLRGRLPETPPSFRATFAITADEKRLFLHRTHRFVEALAEYVLTSAMDNLDPDAVRRRLGCIRTKAVASRRLLYLVRHRYALRTGKTQQGVLEETLLHAFDPSSGLEPDGFVQSLMEARPSSNLDDSQKRKVLDECLRADRLPYTALGSWEQGRAAEITDVYQRVRARARHAERDIVIQPEGLPDLVGIYAFEPEALK